MPKCFDCDNIGDHSHHVVPRIRGGTRTVLLCTECHSKVHNNKMATPELIKEGIRKKRDQQNGKWGPDRKRDDSIILGLRISGLSIRQIAKKLNISSTSVARSIKEEEEKRKSNYLKQNGRLPWAI